MISFFFFNDTATTEIYTLSLHDALPISSSPKLACREFSRGATSFHLQRHTHNRLHPSRPRRLWVRSEEHTSELQSRQYLVCRLLLEKKKQPQIAYHSRAEPTTLCHGTPQ